MMNAISLFSGAGIGDFYLNESDINVVLANEVLEGRAKAYTELHKGTKVLVGDIRLSNIKEQIVSSAKNNNVKFVIATPPCQGLSKAGMNKTGSSILEDKRNLLALNAVEIVEAISPDYLLVENVPRFRGMLFPHGNELVSFEQLLSITFGVKYNIDVRILDAADFGVPQTRNRIVYRIWRKGLDWTVPAPEKHVTLLDAIGDLPSLEAGQSSDIKNHFARKHPANQIIWMQNTPTGASAYSNNEFYPQKENGEKIRGYHNCYMRMRWDRPASTITMRNEIISSQENVHPGRPLWNGLWSDARVLTLRELLIVSSLPPDLDAPKSISETSFRHLIGEGIPPLMLKKIIQGIDSKPIQSRLSALSLFAGGGIAETYFKETGIDVKVANELLQDRAEFYKYCFKTCDVIPGDIRDKKVFDSVVKSARKNSVKFILATPPCQGMSTLGTKQYATDARNELFWYVIKAIDSLEPDYTLIENVPKFIKLLFEYEGQLLNIVDILKRCLGNKYKVEMRFLNAMNYGIPQSRPRAIIKIYKKELSWPWPKEASHVITLKEAIGDLPSLDPGETSDYKWHTAEGFSKAQIEALRYTPEGKSALKNEVFYPKKPNGERVKGFHNTYKRMKWSEPAPARTTNSYLVSGHNNVHPGRLLENGLWSDPRALTLRELIIVSSLPLTWDIPENSKEPFVRQLIGEAIPSLLSKVIVQEIFNTPGEES
jgi:DNA (cytosine-5)-methyltransferase 1